MKTVPLSRLRKFESLPPQSLVRVYTLQGDEAMDNLSRDGYLSGDSQHIEQDGDWKEAYAWMRSQMEKRIPDFSGDYPIWTWLKRPSSKPKPCRYRGTGENNRVIALVPKSRILLSDYDLWHSPLNNSPIYRTEPDFDLDALRDDPRSTWEQIFSFPLRSREEIYWLGSMNGLRVQGCVDRIYSHEIVSTRSWSK